jgi:hypothetical protein
MTVKGTVCGTSGSVGILRERTMPFFRRNIIGHANRAGGSSLAVVIRSINSRAAAGASIDSV